MKNIIKYGVFLNNDAKRLNQDMRSYIKNSMDAGALHTHFNTVTEHLLYIKTLNISPIQDWRNIGKVVIETVWIQYWRDTGNEG